MKLHIRNWTEIDSIVIVYLLHKEPSDQLFCEQFHIEDLFRLLHISDSAVIFTGRLS